jgi:hypothetical protein
MPTRSRKNKKQKSTGDAFLPKLSVPIAKNFTSISINTGCKIINVRNRTQIIYGCPPQIPYFLLLLMVLVEFFMIQMCRIFTPQAAVYLSHHASLPNPLDDPDDFPPGNAASSEPEEIVFPSDTSSNVSGEQRIVLPRIQVPGISIASFVQNQIEKQWVSAFSSLAMDDKLGQGNLLCLQEADSSSSNSEYQDSRDYIWQESESSSSNNGNGGQGLDDEDPYPVIDVSEYVGTNRFVFDKAEISYMRLWDLLDRINAPLYVFNEVLAIVREEALAKRCPATAQHPSRVTLFFKMIAVFGNGVVPVCSHINLETDQSHKTAISLYLRI